MIIHSKIDKGIVRHSNQDAFIAGQLSPDVTFGIVCDGMGGMNAGEVASDIAVKTIKEWFTTDKLTDTAVANPCKYIASAIVAADAAIKAHSKANPDTDGMGSTIVMAWLLGQKVYVGWCGDSRCYRFNPQLGLERLSHDHSYVQYLVDTGRISAEEARTAQNRNIITRAVGTESSVDADVFVTEIDCAGGAVYALLCSDGLTNHIGSDELASIITSDAEVSLKATSTEILLSVSDTGIGIPPEHQDRIFERFYRVDKSHSKAVGGTGLGLSIVKHAALIHHAQIKLDSTPGTGTTIQVRFPRKMS